MKEKENMNLKEAAEWLGLAPKTLRAAVAAGKVPCLVIGRRYIFNVVALREFIRR